MDIAKAIRRIEKDRSILENWKKEGSLNDFGEGHLYGIKVCLSYLNSEIR